MGAREKGWVQERRVGYKEKGLVQERIMVGYKREQWLSTREKGWLQERRVGYKREWLDKDIRVG